MRLARRAGGATTIGLALATATCSGGASGSPPILTCATMGTPDMTFTGPGTLDTGVGAPAIGAGYGQTSCPNRYLVELDLTQPMFQGHDTFVAGVWTPTVPASPCDERATMDVFVYDGTAWKSWDSVSYAGVGGGSICRPRAQSHTDPASSGLDGTKLPSALSFRKARIAVGARQGSTKLPVFVSAASL